MSSDLPKKVKTKDRILAASLTMFNQEGEPNVTTNAIADELDMSPGNLHYHFKTKPDLVRALFTRFEREVSALFEFGESDDVDVVEAWMKLTVLFEIMWIYRFVYRDLAQLTAKYTSIRRPTAQLLHRKILVAQQGCTALGIDDAEVDIESLSRNIVALMTYWISFELACGVEGDDRLRFGRGAYQIFQLLIPYLDEESRDNIEALVAEYLNDD